MTEDRNQEPDGRTGRALVADARRGGLGAAQLALLAGAAAYQAGATLDGCPFAAGGTSLAANWRAGWRDAEIKAERGAAAASTCMIARPAPVEAGSKFARQLRWTPSG